MKVRPEVAGDVAWEVLEATADFVDVVGTAATEVVVGLGATEVTGAAAVDEDCDEEVVAWRHCE